MDLATLLEGTVASIGEAGQLISDITEEQLESVPRGENTIVKFGGHETHGLFPVDHGQPDATMVAYLGNRGVLEIEIVGVSHTLTVFENVMFLSRKFWSS